MEYIIRPYRQGEEEFVAQLHKQLYTEEYSWGPDFIDYAVNIPREFAKKKKNSKEELFVADSGGQLLGCIMLCQSEEASTGQLRLFAVEKNYRGHGIANALINAFMDKARSAGYKKLMLWTASPLSAAIHHYEKLGFHEVERLENTTWHTSGDTLFEIKMEMDII